MLSRITLILISALAGLCLAQQGGHQEITLDSETLSRYTGAYQITNGPAMLITLENGQLLSKLGNQQAVAIYPESKTLFFLKVVNATLEFGKDDERGRPTELVLHQNGRDLPMKRLDDAQAKAVTDAAAALAKRIHDQTAAPGGLAALRGMIEGLRDGKPDYDSMSAGLAGATRQQLPQIQAELQKLGSLRSLTFKGVGPGGMDIYTAGFENGALEYRIALGLDGKIEGANARPTTLEASADSLRGRLPEIESLVAADFARQPIGSVTVGVVSGKDLIWTKSWGQADMEKKIAADAETVYRIGSITKMFTAVMLEQLAEAGKVRLSDPVEKYFPEIQTVQGRIPNAPPITLIQLATHTSGLGREPDNTDTYVTGPVADWEKTLIAALPHTHYQFEPGTRYSYSNIGYAILGAALARAAGEPYTAYIPKHIFQPLGMTHTALERNEQMLPHLSKGYQVMGPGGEVDSATPQREHDTGRGYKVPNGAIYTTAGDLARFASFLLGKGPESVLKSASLERFQMQTIVPANLDLSSGYGIGFEAQRRDGYVAFGHGGAVAGYTAMLLMNRPKGIGVVAFSNGAANPAGIAQRVLDNLSK
jgi:CubicO group peptidase (beta-lactamase class C family)